MHRRRNSSVGIAALTAGILAGATPALAVLNGALDGNHHPGVGFVFAQQTDPNVCSAEVVSTCSATLPSSTVAVPSGGCAEVFADAADYGTT
jgi:hypothetical protein